MAIQKTEAFVLKTQPFRTTSLIVTAFSRSFGKLKGIVKGVRKEAISHPSTFEPFTLIEIVFYEKLRSELHLISESSILETFEPVRSRLEILATAYYFSELVDQLTEAEDPHEQIFELLEFSFRWLPVLDLTFAKRFFEMQLLAEIGLLPNLGGCLGCGKENLDPAYFSVRQGGLFCPDCRKKSPESAFIRRRVLETMKFLTGEKIEMSLQVSSLKDKMVGLEKGVLKELGGLTDRFITERLGKRLLTRRFLRQVEAVSVNSRARRSPLNLQNSE